MVQLFEIDPSPDGQYVATAKICVDYYTIAQIHQKKLIQTGGSKADKHRVINFAKCHM